MTDPRADAPALPWSELVPEATDIAIIGGGFSGLATLLNVLRFRPGTRVVVIERMPRAAPGIAYGACDPLHLLNVPAARMGIFDDDPASFHRWLEARQPGRHGPDDFVPRALFGRHVLGELSLALERATLPPRFLRAEVTSLQRDGADWRLHISAGGSVRAHAVLLAPGLPAAPPPWPAADAASCGADPLRVVADPWVRDAFSGLDSMAEVMIVGSGLTAIDASDALRRQGHQGRIHLVSRNGRLPLPHAPPGTSVAMRSHDFFQGTPLQVLRVLRRLAGQQAAAGMPWQSALDAIRPHVTPLWQSWSAAERRQFLRHARPLWEIHRHRAPAPALANLAAQQSAGRLTLRRGQVRRLQANADGTLRVTLAHPGGSSSTQDVARLFNCTGPSSNLRRSDNALLQQLLASGCASTDELALGLRTDTSGCLLGGNGQPQAGLVLVGSLRRGELWESTAVPELRLQCERAARVLVAGLPASVAS